MIKITRFFYIHILVLPLMVLSFFVGSSTTFFITYGVVLLHELCHLLAALCLRVKVFSIIVMPFGMTVRLSPQIIREPKKEVLIALAGPLSNLLMLAIGLCFLSSDNMNLFLFLIANAAVFLLNLLPIPPLDGGRVLRAIVIHKWGFLPAAKVMRRLSYCLIGLMIGAGVFLLLQFRGNISLLMIAAFLCYNLVSEKKNGDLLTMRMMIYEKEHLRRSGFVPTKHVTLHESASAKVVFRRLNFSSFYLISVLGEDWSVVATLTESDVIRAITKKGYHITLKQCL